jgi:N-acetylglucosaminyl-diphospho-decaprenol L-rhamnosyltransferase
MVTQDDRTRTPQRAGRPKLSVVIVTFNSSGALSPLLDSIPAGLEGVDDYEIIIADNASHDGSAELAEAHPIRPRVIRMGRNAGYAAAINAAATMADRGSALLVLNPDLRLYPHAVMPLLEHITGASVGVVVPTNFSEEGHVDLTLRREPSIVTAWADALLGGGLAGRFGLGETITKSGSYSQRGLVDWATGSALLISENARNAVGEWDESFFLYSEEVDFLRRVREAGFGVLYEPAAKVMHAGGGSGRNPKLFALQTANRIRYYALHHGALATLVFRLGVVTGEALRCWRSPSHRAAFSSSLKPLLKGADFMLLRS